MKLITLLFTISCIGLFSCSQPSSRIFYLNSFHQGYGSSDEVMHAITKTLKAQKIHLETWFMDTKNLSATEQIQAQAQIASIKITQLMIL